MLMTTTILHISADFPDNLAANKTKAVEWLIRETDGFRHVVYSLNRVSWRTGIAMQEFGEDRIAMAYGAPPYGIGLVTHLAMVSKAIALDLQARGIKPDIIHAHKLAVEAVIADQLSGHLDVPFISNLWGHTDCKYFESKPSLRGFYRKLAQRAMFLIPPAPWTTTYFQDALGLGASRFQLLPVITAADEQLEPVISDGPRLVTICNLDAWQRKGISMLGRAVEALASEIPDISLDIYGRGGPKTLLEMHNHFGKLMAEGRISLRHGLDHGSIQATMNRYAAFVLPSWPETYGMVYVEAILAGVPILWSHNQGVDGLFEHGQVGYSCNPQSLDDVVGGLRKLITEQSRLKAEIRRLQGENAFRHLRREGISARYAELINEALSASAHAVASVA
jgi:glycosyltransferase involved in cell wall biosynthesis